MPVPHRCLRVVALALTTSACSVFPAATKTPSVFEAALVEYTFATDAPRAIEVPASTPEITVLELTVQPAPRGERFERGHRILLLPFDCEHAILRCRVQRWSSAEPLDLAARPRAGLFPGAASVRFVDEPTP